MKPQEFLFSCTKLITVYTYWTGLREGGGGGGGGQQVQCAVCSVKGPPNSTELVQIRSSEYGPFPSRFSKGFVSLYC